MYLTIYKVSETKEDIAQLEQPEINYMSLESQGFGVKKKKKSDRKRP